MADALSNMVVGAGTTIQGKIQTGVLEIQGHVEGEILAKQLVVRHSGSFRGVARVDHAVVEGTIEGQTFVRQLLEVQSQGVVRGTVEYGQLTLQEGGILSADMRNVPPKLVGDFTLSVRRGRSAPITTADLSAIDPDDLAQDLMFAVSQTVNGSIAMADAPGQPVQRFTQSDLLQGKVIFCHDGSTTPSARFQVVVSDRSGATSGKPQVVSIVVQS